MKRANYDIDKDWEMVIAYVLLPIGRGIDIITYFGKDVPEILTIHHYLKSWQRNVSRDPKLRDRLNITPTNKKCPKCGGRIYQSIDEKNNIHYWCGRYPDCDYMEVRDDEGKIKKIYAKIEQN